MYYKYEMITERTSINYWSTSSFSEPRKKPKSLRPLSDEEFKHVINYLENSELLLKIDSSRILVEEKQFFQIMGALYKSKRCNLSDFCLEVAIMNDNTVEKIASLIKKDIKLRSLDLSRKIISIREATILLGALKKNITLVQLKLSFHHDVLPMITAEIKQLINRNIDIQHELKRFNYYYAAAIISRIANFPKDITYLILDYCNEAIYYEVRTYIKKALYEKVIAMSKKTSSEKVKIVLQEDLLNKKLLQIQQEFIVMEQRSGFINHDDLSINDTTEDEDTTLLFSTLNDMPENGTRLNREMQTNTYNYLTPFNCCVIN